MAGILSYEYEGKDWPLLPPGPKGKLVSCCWCDNILNDDRAYCSVCGKNNGHWDPFSSEGQPCHMCKKKSTMACVQCNKPVCIDCSQSSKSGCIGATNNGHMDITNSLLRGPQIILTCQECINDMKTLEEHYQTIFNVNGDYKYENLDSCLWHGRKTISKCIICNKPLCEICAYFKQKSFLRLNKKYVGPYCHEHLQQPKKWAIWAQLNSK